MFDILLKVLPLIECLCIARGGGGYSLQWPIRGGYARKGDLFQASGILKGRDFTKSEIFLFFGHPTRTQTTVHLQLLNGMQRSKPGIFFLTLKTMFLQQINQCKGLNWVHERGIIL